jgi:predicted membrane-bound spermidine synthase
VRATRRGTRRRYLKESRASPDAWTGRLRAEVSLRSIALLLTVLTGFSGLVYQVVWQKYLAVLLGSHSEATAAVLGIFLGGLSSGYLLFGRLCRRLAASPLAGGRRRVIFAYGLVESAIGLYAFAFPALFEVARAASLAAPAGRPSLGFAIDVALTALLIGPPTLLMGGTIPLLTQGLARGLADATRFHSFVYAFNTTGAFAGALCAGFVLVPALGLERSVFLMGGLNAFAGILFLLLARGAGADDVAAAATGESAPRPAALQSLAIVALLSGFAMMTLQTALNRIGALSLGASQFTFSMVVAVFVLSIAAGSFAVSTLPRIAKSVLPLSQWLCVACLLALYPWVEDAPYWAHRLRIGVSASDFAAFQAEVFGGLLLVAIVPLGLSGALLPLLFHELRREASDLGRVAGSLYGWNTVGSLTGALVGGYALFFWLDLHAIYRLAVAALALAAALLSVGRMMGRAPAAAAFTALALLLVLLPAWSPVKLSSGLFRTREAFAYSHEGPDRLFELKQRDLGGDFVRFYRDDPIASIAVHRMQGGSLAILTNGKVDGNIPQDNKTQGLLALLPALLAEKGERAFVIGHGTGMTVGMLGALESFRQVIVAEISPAVIEAARAFEGLNGGALANPKTEVVRSDAFRALLRSGGRFDVIVSEPSNPWLTGVEMLYSVDFLRAARGRLAPGGVYAQWFQVYESDDETIAIVLRSYLEAFDRVAVWHGESADLIVLGFADSAAGADLERLQRRYEQPDFRTRLAELGITSFPRLLAHELAPVGVFTRDSFPGEVHTLESPILSDVAARAFFRGGEGRLPLRLPTLAARPAWRLYRERFPGAEPPDPDRLEMLRETCEHSQQRCSTLFAEWLHEDPGSPVLAEALARGRTSADLAHALDTELLRDLARLFEPGGAERSSAASRAYDDYFHHAAPFATRDAERDGATPVQLSRAERP